MEWDEHIPLPEIELNKKERKLLDDVEEKAAYATDETFEPAKRLRRFGLVVIQQCRTNKTGVVLSGVGLGLLVVITDKGHDYLSYVRNREASKKADRLHNWKIAIFSAMTGAFLSEPLWIILRMVFSR